MAIVISSDASPSPRDLAALPFPAGGNQKKAPEKAVGTLPSEIAAASTGGTQTPREVPLYTKETEARKELGARVRERVRKELEDRSKDAMETFKFFEEQRRSLEHEMTDADIAVVDEHKGWTSVLDDREEVTNVFMECHRGEYKPKSAAADEFGPQPGWGPEPTGPWQKHEDSWQHSWNSQGWKESVGDACWEERAFTHALATALDKEDADRHHATDMGNEQVAGLVCQTFLMIFVILNDFEICVL